MLVVEVSSTNYVPVGVATVAAGAGSEPDTPLAKRQVVMECGHSYWILSAPAVEVFTENLDQYIIWRGTYQRIGESVAEWFIHKVHEGVMQ